MENLEEAGKRPAENKLPLKIEGTNFDWPHQFITGKEVKELIGASEGARVFLGIEKPWEDEAVADDDRVDLARPGIERFYLKYVLSLIINGKEYEWPEQFITGAQVRKLAMLDSSGLLFLAIKKPWEDEHVGDDTVVDLARPGIEHFFIKAEHARLVNIKVDRIDREIEAGERTVTEIKKAGKVAAGYELDELIEGKLVPLADDGVVCIKGGEQFFSRVKDGTSS